MIQISTEVKKLTSIFALSIVTILAYQNCGTGMNAISAVGSFSSSGITSIKEIKASHSLSGSSQIQAGDFIKLEAVLNNPVSGLLHEWSFSCPNEAQKFINSNKNYEIVSCANNGALEVNLGIRLDGNLVDSKQTSVSIGSGSSLDIKLATDKFLINETVTATASGAQSSNLTWSYTCPGENSISNTIGASETLRFSCANTGRAQISLAGSGNTRVEKAVDIISAGLNITGPLSTQVGVMSEEVTLIAVPNIGRSLSFAYEYTCPDNQSNSGYGPTFKFKCWKPGKVVIKGRILNPDNQDLFLLETTKEFNVVSEDGEEPQPGTDVSFSMKADDVIHNKTANINFTIANPKKHNMWLRTSIQCPTDSQPKLLPSILIGSNITNYTINYICTDSRPGEVKVSAYIMYGPENSKTAIQNTTYNLKDASGGDVDMDAISLIYSHSVQQVSPALQTFNVRAFTRGYNGPADAGTFEILLFCPNEDVVPFAMEKVPPPPIIGGKNGIPIDPAVRIASKTCAYPKFNGSQKVSGMLRLIIGNKRKSITFNLDFEKVAAKPPVLSITAPSANSFVRGKTFYYNASVLTNGASIESLSVTYICPSKTAVTRPLILGNNNKAKASITCDKAGKFSARFSLNYNSLGKSASLNSTSYIGMIEAPELVWKVGYIFKGITNLKTSCGVVSRTRAPGTTCSRENESALCCVEGGTGEIQSQALDRGIYRCFEAKKYECLPK